MNQTYDPILECVPLKRFRVSALRSPAIGTALVLERSVGAPVVVESGGRVPDSRSGNYHTMHCVDVGSRLISFTMSSPSADPAFPFTVVISCVCQVVDPVMIVRDGVRDLALAIQVWATGRIRGTTARHDVLAPTDAEADVQYLLVGGNAPAGVRLSEIAVEVNTRDVADIVTAHRELRVQAMRRDAMRPVARGGREEMLAHVMAMTDGDPAPLLDREQEAKEASTQARLQALKALMSSDKMEEFNTSRISEKAMTEFFGGDPVVGGKRASIRDRIERKREADGADLLIAGAAMPDGASEAAVPSVEEPLDPNARGITSLESEPQPPNGTPKNGRVRGIRHREDG